MNNPAIIGGKERMLDVSEAAEFIGLSASTLNKMRGTGAGPVYIRLGGRRIVYHLADLNAWLNANRRRSTSEQGGRCQMSHDPIEHDAMRIFCFVMNSALAHLPITFGPTRPRKALGKLSARRRRSCCIA